MTSWDYILIPGFETSAPTGDEADPGLYEIFFGIGYVDATAGVLAETPISAVPELAEGLWQGQNEKLEAESLYCDQLQKHFEKKHTRVSGIMDKAIEYIKEMFEEVIGWLAAAIVFWTTDSVFLAYYARFAGEAVAEWGFEQLLLLLERGNALLEGIKDENEKLLQIEKSRENYEYRERVLERHREDIRIILEQIRLAEKQVEITTQLETKALLERLTDLALRDDTIELGNMRLHSKGRVVNF